MKKFGSVEIDLNNSKLYQDGNEIKNVHDIYEAFRIMSIYEYLNDNYCNNEEELYMLATETIELEDKYNLEEDAAIEEASSNLGITLEQEDLDP